MRQRGQLWFRAALALAVCGLIAACTPAAGSRETPVSGEPVAEDVVLTLDAQLTAYGPTNAALLTASAPTSTPTGTIAPTAPTPAATITGSAPPPTATTGPAPTGSTTGNGNTPSGASPTPTSVPTVSRSQVVTGGDVNDTTRVEQIALGQSRTATIESVFNAHNWQFEGSRGQTVTIQVTGSGGADPAVRLIGPDGRSLQYVQDSGGGVNASLTATLPDDGLYTARVDLWVPGDYTITLRGQ